MDLDDLDALLASPLRVSIPDAAAVALIRELRERPNPTEADLELLAELEQAWRAVAAADMVRRK